MNERFLKKWTTGQWKKAEEKKADKKLEHCWTQHKKERKNEHIRKNTQCTDRRKEKLNIYLWTY